jgi:peptidoglycan/xylan/chitin deacetylase (PgdA/CDA1 family)
MAGGPPDVEQRRTWDEGAVVRGDRSRKELALVFTGGEHGEGVGHILDVLQERDLRAAFFLTGDFVGQAALAPAIRRMVAEGHYVGPHSHEHLLYCSWEDRSRSLVDEGSFKADLRKNIAALRRFGACSGPGPIYFIPPYEWFNREQVRWAGEMGITLFNFTPGSGSNRDWIPEGHPGFLASEEILDGIFEFEGRDPHGLNGFFLLLHLGSQRRDKMHLQLRSLIDELLARGYGILRVDAMLEAEPDRG